MGPSRGASAPLAGLCEARAQRAVGSGGARGAAPGDARGAPGSLRPAAAQGSRAASGWERGNSPAAAEGLWLCK